jgi:hypothetical protein
MAEGTSLAEAITIDPNRRTRRRLVMGGLAGLGAVGFGLANPRPAQATTFTDPVFAPRFEAVGGPGTAPASVHINTPAGQSAELQLLENSTSKWSMLQIPSGGYLAIRDNVLGGVNADRMRFFPSGGHVEIPTASWDVSANPADTFRRVAVNVGTFAGGVNSRGAAGDAVNTGATSDKPNLADGTATFWFMIDNIAPSFASRGGLVPVQVGVVQNLPTGSTFPTNNYNEARCMVGGMTVNNRGANTGALELGTNIDAIGNGNGGPARARGAIISIIDANPYSAYDSATFGSGSDYIDRGSINVHLWSNGAGYAGTGLLFAGGGGSIEPGVTTSISAYKRAIVLENRIGGDIFCLDGEGRMGFGRTTDKTTTLGSRITLGYTNAGVPSIVPADGINFGGDINLFRSNTAVLACSTQFNALRHRVFGTGGSGFVELIEQSSDPAAPATDNARLFARDNAGKTELCVRFATGTVQVIKAEP